MKIALLSIAVIAGYLAFILLLCSLFKINKRDE